MVIQQLKKFIVLIPAYNPDDALKKLTDALEASGCRVIIVDDGSTVPITGTMVLRHSVNLGKGAALKFGFNYIAVHYPNVYPYSSGFRVGVELRATGLYGSVHEDCELGEDNAPDNLRGTGIVGIVTADADGQHLLEDILKVGECLEQHSNDLVLGVRSFDTKVPFRSRFGNSMTRMIFNIVTGFKLLDTQTGLRGIPMGQIPTYLGIQSNRYEFELDMLLQAKQHGYGVQQVPIQSVYIDNNKSSHFNPLLDSMRIYFVLFRFILVSVLSFLLDYSVFMITFGVTRNLLMSQYVARLISGTLNYSMNRKNVFSSKISVKKSLPRYIVLAVILGFCSYLLIDFLMTMGLPVAYAKPLAEGVLFIASFSIQRHFVFNGLVRTHST